MEAFHVRVWPFPMERKSRRHTLACAHFAKIAQARVPVLPEAAFETTLSNASNDALNSFIEFDAVTDYAYLAFLYPCVISFRRRREATDVSEMRPS